MIYLKVQKKRGCYVDIVPCIYYERASAVSYFKIFNLKIILIQRNNESQLPITLA